MIVVVYKLKYTHHLEGSSKKMQGYIYLLDFILSSKNIVNLSHLQIDIKKQLMDNKIKRITIMNTDKQIYDES